MRICTLSSTLAFMVLATAPALAQPAGDAADGQRVFMADGCYTCHGTVGQGSGNVGPKLAPNPLPFEGIQSELRHPVKNMPAYSDKIVSDQEIADIHAYLASIPASPLAKDIRLLNQ